MGIGVDENIKAYVITDSTRCVETAPLTAEWMNDVFDTCDLTLIPRFIGDREFRVLAKANARRDDIPSIIGDIVRGQSAVFGCDVRNDRLRDLTADEICALRWATRLCRWVNDDTKTVSMIVAVEMYRTRDDRSPFEICEVCG